MDTSTAAYQKGYLRTFGDVIASPIRYLGGGSGGRGGGVVAGISHALALADGDSPSVPSHGAAPSDAPLPSATKAAAAEEQTTTPLSSSKLSFENGRWQQQYQRKQRRPPSVMKIMSSELNRTYRPSLSVGSALGTAEGG